MNRLEWVLGILLVILLGVVVVLSLLFWFRPNDGGTINASSESDAFIAQQAALVAPTSVYEGQSAKLAFVAARRAATEWQVDAELLNGTATWPQGAPANDLLSGETTWGFSFYSSQTGNSASFSVVDNEAQLIGTSNVTQPYTPLDITGWQVDSDEAIRQLLDSGGFQFIEDEGITILTMALLADNQSQTGQLEWIVSLIGTENGRLLDMRINAHSGELLELTSLP